MPYRLIVLTRSGPSEGPVFRCYLDALGEAVTALRNGITFPQIILNGSGELEKRIEPEARRVKLRPVFGGGFESGSVVTPGLSLMGETFCSPDGVREGGGLSLTGWTSDPSSPQRKGC